MLGALVPGPKEGFGVGEASRREKYVVGAFKGDESAQYSFVVRSKKALRSG